jgi:hypothetical protein
MKPTKRDLELKMEAAYIASIEAEFRASINGYFTPIVWFQHNMVEPEMRDAWFKREVTIDEVKEQYNMNKQIQYYGSIIELAKYFADAQEEIKRDASRNFGGI